MNLLANSAWILDVVFFAIILLGILIGVTMGFLRGICKLAGTIFSIALAVAFCVPFKNNLESWFGLESALADAIGSTTAGQWISVIIAFIILAAGIRLLAWLLGNIGTKLVDKSNAMRTVNRFLGGLLGLVGAAASIFLLLAVFYWISAPGVNAFINDSAIVGAIYKWEWFEYAANFSFI